MNQQTVHNTTVATISSGTSIGVMAWLTSNATVLTLGITFTMLCIAGFTAYTSWRFKNRRDVREQESHDMKKAEFTSTLKGTDDGS